MTKRQLNYANYNISILYLFYEKIHALQVPFTLIMIKSLKVVSVKPSVPLIELTEIV
jgi:hypothetical protein